VYDREPYIRVHLLQAMEEACLDICVPGSHVEDFTPAAWLGTIVMWMRFSGLTQTKELLRRNNFYFYYFIIIFFFLLCYE